MENFQILPGFWYGRLPLKMLENKPSWGLGGLMLTFEMYSLNLIQMCALNSIILTKFSNFLTKLEFEILHSVQMFTLNSYFNILKSLADMRNAFLCILIGNINIPLIFVFFLTCNLLWQFLAWRMFFCRDYLYFNSKSTTKYTFL